MEREVPTGMTIDRDDDPNPKDSDPLLAKKPDEEEAESSKEATSSERESEITKDEEIESSSAACCRICLEYDSGLGDELISPCMCKGTQQFVHRSCLDHWRSVKEGLAFSHCTTCKAQFHLRVEFLENYPWRKIKFRLFVARDVFLVFLFVQTVIACLGGLAYFLDRDGEFRNSFSDSWDRFLSKHPVPFYYCIGVLMFVPVLPGLFSLLLCLLANVGTYSISIASELQEPILSVMVFFVLLGFFGLIMHCSSFNNNDPCLAGCRNCCYGWGILDCFPASMEACFALVVIFVIFFAILGIAYGFLAATMAVQRIWQSLSYTHKASKFSAIKKIKRKIITVAKINSILQSITGSKTKIPVQNRSPGFRLGAGPLLSQIPSLSLRCL